MCGTPEWSCGMMLSRPPPMHAGADTLPAMHWPLCAMSTAAAAGRWWPWHSRQERRYAGPAAALPHDIEHHTVLARVHGLAGRM